jgi:predicted nuclease with TOPRIM domain
MIFNALKANAKVKELETEKSNLITQLATAQTALKEAQDNLGVILGEKQTFEKQLQDLADGHAVALETLTNEFNTKLATAESKLKDETISTNTKAAEQLAKIGVNLEELPKISEKEQVTTKGYSVKSHITPQQ